jgi:hypothetical protein
MAPSDTEQVEAQTPSAVTKTLIARCGQLLIVTDPLVSSSDLVQRLVHALGKDSRVLEAHAPTLDPKWTIRPPLSLANSPDRGSDVLAGEDGFRSLIADPPICFTVNVPRKNQPLLAAEDAAPAERYEVIWNGFIAVVAWEQEKTRVGLSGGQVVNEIIHDACHEAGADLLVQACNPYCDFQFIHATIRGTSATTEVVTLESARSNGSDYVDLHVPSHRANARAFAEWIFDDLHADLETFARLKNRARRLLVLETLARETLASLLGLYQADAERAIQPWRQRLAARWKARGWRKRARREVAVMWRSIAMMEQARREVGEMRTELDAWYSSIPQPILLCNDLDELPAVDSLDLTTLQLATQHASDRLDNRSVALAPAWGALAGGLMGALVSRL